MAREKTDDLFVLVNEGEEILLAHVTAVGLAQLRMSLKSAKEF